MTEPIYKIFMKLQIDILILNIKFWHCKNSPITFAQGFFVHINNGYRL